MLRNCWVIKSNFCTINNRLELAFEEIFKVFNLKAKMEKRNCSRNNLLLGICGKASIISHHTLGYANKHIAKI